MHQIGEITPAIGVRLKAQGNMQLLKKQAYQLQ